jgi:hypothetical protein
MLPNQPSRPSGCGGRWVLSAGMDVAQHDPHDVIGCTRALVLAVQAHRLACVDRGQGSPVQVDIFSTFSVALAGIDLILEGEAARVTEPPVLEQLAHRYREGGWPAEVEGDGFTAPFSAPSAGPPPWYLYRFRFHTVVGRHRRAVRHDSLALRTLTGAAQRHGCRPPSTTTATIQSLRGMPRRDLRRLGAGARRRWLLLPSRSGRSATRGHRSGRGCRWARAAPGWGPWKQAPGRPGAAPPPARPAPGGARRSR